jgi:hypothetical protein
MATKSNEKANPEPSSKFKDFLTEKKIDARRILSASAKLERLTVEDRKIRLAKRQAKGAADDKKPEAASKKPRSGRPITDRAMASALSGRPLSGPQKTRLLRALNHVLEQKKLGAVELSALF